MGCQVVHTEQLVRVCPGVLQRESSARSEVGEIVIRGANVTTGYENNPKANAENWTNN